MIESVKLLLDATAFARCAQIVCAERPKLRGASLALAAQLVAVRCLMQKCDRFNESMVSCVLAYVFFKLGYGRPRREALFKLFSLAAIYYSVRFVSSALTGLLPVDDGAAAFAECVATCLFCFFLLPLFKPERLAEVLLRGGGTTVLMTLCAFCLLFAVIVNDEMKYQEGGDVASVVVVLVVLLFLWAIAEGFFERKKASEMEERIRAERELRKEYDRNIENLRIRQHSFQNHMAAVQAASCPAGGAVAQYCEEVLTENGSARLLLLGDSILGGFVYAKMEEIRKMGCRTECEVSDLSFLERLPPHRMTEAIGILIDNAREELEGQDAGYFKLTLFGNGLKVQNSVRKCVTQEEMGEWFRPGWSSKGKERGLGLQRLKELGKEYGFEITCCNVADGNGFMVEIGIELKP